MFEFIKVCMGKIGNRPVIIKKFSNRRLNSAVVTNLVITALTLKCLRRRLQERQSNRVTFIPLTYKFFLIMTSLFRL